MAKDKSQPKGQKSIASFFGGSKKKKDDPSSDVDMDDDDDASIVPTKKGTKSAAPDASDLPPIHDVPAIFSDLVSRIPHIKQVADHVSGRKLRVATMCSGTESPLLALELIQKSLLEQHGVNFEIEHVFSCEIEPFKQAYIERNFHPPILFRDVCELGGAEAHTAYGALAPVPGDVDLLVAGTSCVDYSNLNNEKQDIDANGESGRTFRGMMSWITNHRPPIVILENVCSAPWSRVQEKFEAHGYSATFSRVDTKQYYIPHTRTRVYLIAVDKKNSSIPDEWKDYVTSKLKRPASSTLDAFLLASDDPRIHHARQKLVQESYNALDRRTGRTDWSRCESRHQRARLEEGLGSKRPLTSWDEGGFCKLPDFAWGDWGIGQVERVWDLMDISVLRDAKKGIDPSYKTQVWNLSQNVDRTIGSNKVGICPCLTPSMIPYITNRGGPMVGLEALSMQGLPVDKLLLTRETEDQLADLAGNAMSTTVVGSCILAALVCGKKLLKAGDDSESYESKRGTQTDAEMPMEVDHPVEDVVAMEDRITGEGQLVEKPLNLSATGNRSLADLLKDAEKSARLCECEGRTDMTARELFRCKDCGTPYCKKCGGRPEHNPEPIIFSAENPRLPPSEFTKELKASLPMSISLSGVSQEVLDGLKESANIKIPEARWSSWCAAVLRAAKSELRFVEPKRQEYWSAVYQSPEATLELFLHPQQTEWRLFANPEEHEPANAEIRRLLETPVGRFTCAESLLSGSWDFALPHNSSVTVKVKGEGELVPSWEARLGLTEDAFKNKMIFSRLRVSVANSDIPKLDRDISGVYTLYDRCGTANGALHKRSSDEGTLPPLFMLMDPHRTSDSEDSFVFSISRRRHQYGEARPIVAKLSPSWRQSSNEEEEEVSCRIPCKWVRAENVHLMASKSTDAKFSVPAKGLEIPVSEDACRSATALLTCTVPLNDHAGPEWPRGSWQEVDKIHERGTFKALAWLLERIRDAGNNFSSWQDVTLPEGQCNCERCAPAAPHIQWTQVNKKVVPVEDPVEAGEFERRLKKRPSPFVTQLRLTEDNMGIVRIGVNIPSLLHRALFRLPKAGRIEKPTLSWRLNMNFTPVISLNLPKFVISSNKLDKEHAQPPSFKVPLRKEQLRSLEWMLKQESRNAAPFIEEEISESILDPLGWRAEGRAQRPVHIRGGVLADQVGYGKTAITLGLIDCAAKDVEKEFKAMGRVKGKIMLKSTLIVVPPHLTRQWDSEVRKFTKKGFKVLVLSTVSNLNSATIEDFQDADIVVVASNLFKSNVYLDNLQLLAAAGALPSKEGRHFNANLRKALESLKAQTDRLQDKGSEAVMQEIQDAQKRVEEEAARVAAAIQSKRLKGKSYRDAADQKEAEKQAARAAKANSPRRFKKVEVVIPRLSHSVSSEASSPTTAEQSDSDTNKRPKRRAAASRKAIVISDDEGDSTTSEAAAMSKKVGGKAKKVGNAKKGGRKSKRAVSDDDEEFEMEASDVDDDDNRESSPTSVPSSDEYDDEEDEEDISKKPSKKPIPKSKSKARRPSVSSTPATEDEDMDVDEPKKPAKKPTKRKAGDEGERPAKKQKRVDNDPWKLESKPVRKDWTQMRAPPLEMFHFARKVVDEYTYLDGKVHSLVTNLTAERHWVLSGTPPIHDFAALKTIAAFLNIHLGVDDDGEGQSAEVKKRRREQTEVEKFHSFREVHSHEWHAHRHELGQAFLDQFVRQNIAEIDEIPWTEKVVDIILPAAERAIYLELEHHLRALDMTIKRGKKTESDREKRLAKSLGESKSAEEALLKRCSHFDLETSNENAMKACDVIVAERQKQLDECKAELLKAVKDGVKREKGLSNVGSESMFHEWIRVCRSEGVDDKEATEMVIELLDEAGVGAVKGKAKREDVNLSEKTKAQVWEHREKTHEIRRLTKELVGRVRSLRYFTVVRDLQKQREEPPIVNCPNCERQKLPISDVAVLSSCGHMGCLECVRTCAEREECVYAASGACKSAARVLNVVKADTLGVDDEDRDGQGKHFGMKLEKVVNLINKEIPKKERVLVFVQFPDLMKKVTEALTYNKIKFLEIRGTAHQKSKNLETFQNESEERVLLLNVMDESASGANLTSANHAVFLSPLLAPSKEIYKACETQAVGRLVRYGQEKHVYVWRFLTRNSVDEDIYNQRRDVQPTTS